MVSARGICRRSCAAIAGVVGVVGAGGVSPAAAVEASRLVVDDFAVGRVIEPGSPRALQSATLDLDVYRASVEPGLADLRVFNGAGETLPHAIRAAPPAAAREAERVRLPVFPLAEPTARSKVSGRFEIDAEISESGAILRMRDGRAARSGPADRGAWLVDASGLDGEPVVGLELGLLPSSDDFIAYLRVDASNDLTGFSTLVGRVALARLSRDGHEIERLDLELPGIRARYLKLSLIEGELPGSLQSVTARITTPAQEPELRRTRVAGRRIEDEPGRLLYDIPADLPIEWIDVVPGEPNTLLDVRIDSARDSAGPWRRRYEGLVYRLEPGGKLRNAPIRWRGGSVRHLRLTLLPRGGVEASATPPEIELGWRPAQILFVARGEGPFTLAYGRLGARDTAFEASRIVGLAADERARLDETTASLGPPIVRAGDRAYAPPPRAFPWRRIALWTVLIMVVGVVVRMSLRLLARADDPSAEDPSGEDPSSDDVSEDDVAGDEAASEERML